MVCAPVTSVTVPYFIIIFLFISCSRLILHNEIKKRMIGLKEYWAGWNEKESGRKIREIIEKQRQKEWRKDEYRRCHLLIRKERLDIKRGKLPAKGE